MSAKIIRVDFATRKVIEPSLLQKLDEAEENELHDDLAFFNSEHNRQLIRGACVQGLGLLKQCGITTEGVLPSRKRDFERTPLKVLCELILHSDPSSWPSRPNYYGAAVAVLHNRYKKLYKIDPEIKKLLEQT